MRALSAASPALLLLVTASCQLLVDTAGLRGGGGAEDGGVPDGSEPPGACANEHAPALFAYRDLPPAPDGLVTLLAPSYEIDTSQDEGPLRDLDSGDEVAGIAYRVVQTVHGTEMLAVVADELFLMNARIRATGARPLLLAMHGKLVMSGGSTIDVSSTPGIGGDGAGAPAGCAVGPGGDAPQEIGDTSGGGGGGGATPGGIGGGPNGGAGGAAVPTEQVDVRAGCAGGLGAGKSQRALGGGAVLVFACERIDLNDGAIAAGGRGGEAGGIGPGGGGGASNSTAGTDGRADI